MERAVVGESLPNGGFNFWPASRGRGGGEEEAAPMGGTIDGVRRVRWVEGRRLQVIGSGGGGR